MFIVVVNGQSIFGQIIDIKVILIESSYPLREKSVILLTLI